MFVCMWFQCKRRQIVVDIKFKSICRTICSEEIHSKKVKIFIHRLPGQNETVSGVYIEQGNLLRGIDNYLGSARSGPGQQIQ